MNIFNYLNYLIIYQIFNYFMVTKKIYYWSGPEPGPEPESGPEP